MSAHVPLPDLRFRDGTPFAQAFDDVYFSKAGGVEETTHVFLQGNGLPERFAGRPQFTIGELGFGTGLNFLVAWQAFLTHAPADHHLHYLSFEKFPLTPAMLREVLAAHPGLSVLAEALIAAYPLRLPGLHRIHLPRVTLTLVLGDAAELLPQVTGGMVDAWFLDGFAPAKNAAMWSEAIFQEIGRLSAPHASFATFTSAGFVRRGLAAQGFAVAKVPGYGHKREMSVGTLERDHPPTPLRTSTTAVIIGGGIAGCTLARALAERGHAVTLLERGEIAGGASGNPAGVLFPQLTKRWTTSASWYFSAYSFTLQQLARWRSEGLSFATGEIGMLRLPRHAEEEAQLRGLNETLGLDREIVHWVDQENATEKAGVALTTGGAYFPKGTWVAPGELCRALLGHPNIAVHTQCEVASIARQGKEWHVKTADHRSFSAENCCITVAHEIAAFLAEPFLRVSKVGGQISGFAADQVTAPLSTILCHKGYVIPHRDGYLVGATYNHGDDSLQVTSENHQKNRDEVATFLPGWLTGNPSGGRTAFRATTPDRLPYVGAVGDGLYLSVGHGSRGLLSAPLAAEALASEISGELSPLSAALRAAIHPLRFRP